MVQQMICCAIISVIVSAIDGFPSCNRGKSIVMNKRRWNLLTIIGLVLTLLACAQPVTQSAAVSRFVDLADAPPDPYGGPSTTPTPTPSTAPLPPSHVRRVNAPYFGSGNVVLGQTAVFWLGQETISTQYGDIRIGYNNSEIWVNANVMDRSLWYNNRSFGPQGLTNYDSVSLYLDRGGNGGAALDGNAFRFDAQFTWYERDRSRWQAAYQSDGSSWMLLSNTFSTEATWRGNEPNTTRENRGWMVTYHIPFSALGLSGPPTQGTVWGLAVALHNRNDAAGTPIPDQVWPEAMRTDSPLTWGQLHFGLAPAYAAPSATNLQTMQIKQGLNGQVVTTTNVGGYTQCGENIGNFGQAYWEKWGVQNWAGQSYLNVMNQADIADWACYNKVYAQFPLGTIPAGKVITSAKVTFYQYGHAGDPGQNPGPSLIQLSGVDGGWDPHTINWNNAPWPTENLDRQWAGTGDCPNYKNCPAVTWDVSQLVADAYKTGQPLRFILYTADDQISSGKYFFASEMEDWNDANRPVLEVTYGDAP